MILDHHKFHMLSFLQFYGNNTDKFFAMSAIIFFSVYLFFLEDLLQSIIRQSQLVESN